ncbi:MAG: acyltransferase, partial [Actinobacteria bacterium]|nr:acyltransferase [Actinomycetota bacterium]
MEFYRRRFWRIYPSLVSVVGIGLVVILLFDPYPDASVRTGLFGLVGLANVEQYLYRSDYFIQQVGVNAYTHLWSLGVEEQFYFIFPIILLILVRLRRTASKALLLGLPLCISLSVYVAVISSGRASVAFYLFPFRYWEIALGMVLATVDSKIHRLHLGLQRAALFVGFGGIFGSLIAIRPSDSLGPIVSTVSTTLALIGVRHTRFSSKPAKGLLITSLIHIGRRSYSLYLVHWVLLVVFR